MRFNAGHALNYFNVRHVAEIEGLSELHIGHAIISRSMFVDERGCKRYEDVIEGSKIMILGIGIDLVDIFQK